MTRDAEPTQFEEIPLPDSLPGRLYRVSRPGRSSGSEQRVSRDLAGEWVRRVIDRLLPAGKDRIEVDYICLLGWKRDGGRREIADFYEACGPEDEGGSPPFEDYLNDLAGGRVVFRLHHVPTTDHEPVPREKLEQATARLLELLAEGRTVLIGCSAAMGRTREVLRFFETTTRDLR